MNRRIHLIDCVPRDLVASQNSRPTSVSEILLSLSDSQRRLAFALGRMGFTINRDNIILIPFKKEAWKKYLIATRHNRPYDPPIRPEVLFKLRKQYDDDTLDSWLWPPDGDGGGIWDSINRTFVSVYLIRALQVGPKIPTRLIRKYGIVNKESMIKAITEGSIALLGPTTIEIKPTGPLNRLATPMLKAPKKIPQLNVLYRGTIARYDDPLTPSFYREFRTPEQAQQSDRITQFAINLVLEAVADEFGLLLTHNEAESIIQHYKILPWTKMIDLTTNVNVAKAFAATQSSSDSRPHLYQVVVWNLLFFDNGPQLMAKLKFSRPKKQSAIAHFGLALDMKSRTVFDPYRLIVNVSEHPIEKDGSGWERFGGPSFSLYGNEFTDPFLDNSDYNKLQDLLRFRKFETVRCIRVIKRVVNILKKKLDYFGELEGRTGTLEAALKTLAITYH